MTLDKQLDGLDAVALGKLVRDGEITARELYRETRARVEAVNGQINAVVEDLSSIAEDCLTGIESGKLDKQSPLAGVPIFLKALMSAVEGAPLTAASQATRGLIALFDSSVTARLKQAGTVICGMTNSPELGLNTSTESQYYGPARNPWGENLSTGGSSGGAAAAVAAGIVPLAHASDGGGSIRIPSACCGLVGLKPSRGRVSFAPAAGEGWAGMAYVNAVSRTVRDSAAFLDLIAGPEPGDPYSAQAPARPFLEEVGVEPRPLRIGLCVKSFNGEAVDPACTAAVREAALRCEELGHEVHEIEPAHDTESFWPTIEPVIAANVAAALTAIGRLRGKAVTSDEIECNTAQMREMGEAMTATDYLARVAQMNLISRQVAGLFAKVDIILTPTMAVPEIPLGFLDTRNEDRDVFGAAIRPTTAFTALFNVTGMPAISLPLVWRENGLPIGVQFAAPGGDEATLIRLASQLETAFPWRHRRPPVFAGAG